MPNKGGNGGTIQNVDVSKWPILEGSGLSYALIILDPCSVTLPHVHPRANEIIFVISAKKLRVGFVEENGGRTIINDIRTGEVIFFWFD